MVVPLTILDRVDLFLRSKRSLRAEDRQTGIAIRFVKQFDIVPDPRPIRDDWYYRDADYPVKPIPSTPLTRMYDHDFGEPMK